MRAYKILRSWLPTIWGWLFIIGLVVAYVDPFAGHSSHTAARDLASEKAAQEASQAERRAQEIEYEKQFYDTEEKVLHDGGTPTLIRVATPKGDVTGKWLFIPNCPKGFYCAQPDGRLTDEEGDDLSGPVDDAAQPDSP